MSGERDNSERIVGDQWERVSRISLRGRLVTTPIIFHIQIPAQSRRWAEGVFDVSEGMGSSPDFLGVIFPRDLIKQARILRPGDQITLVGDLHVHYRNDANGYPTSLGSEFRVTSVPKPDKN